MCAARACPLSLPLFCLLFSLELLRAGSVTRVCARRAGRLLVQCAAPPIGAEVRAGKQKKERENEKVRDGSRRVAPTTPPPPLHHSRTPRRRPARFPLPTPQNPAAWTHFLAESGPTSWAHAAVGAPLPHLAHEPATTVSHLATTATSVSFDVSRLGTPIEVKISYFPNWHVSGATGPYRVSPNLMVVVPTSHHVTLTYGNTSWGWWGNVITDFTAVAAAVALWRRRWWRRPRRYSEAEISSAISIGVNVSVDTVISADSGTS